MLQRRRAAVQVGPGRPPAVPQAVCLQEVFRQPQVRQRAIHPDVRAATSPRRRAPALPSGPGWHPAPVFPEPAELLDVRAVSSGSQLAPAWHPELVTLQPAERHRGVRAAWRPALASRTGWVWASQVSWPGELPAPRAMRSELALPLAQAVPQVPLKVAWLQQAEVAAGAGHPDASVLPRAAA